MNAQLRPIAEPITPPVYDNSNLRVRDRWVTDNANALLDYWQACPGDAADDFEGFCWCQWDREQAKRDEFRNTLRMPP